MGEIYYEDGEYLTSLLAVCRALSIAPEAPEVNNNFERLVAVFNAIEDENAHLLLQDIKTHKFFSESIEGVEFEEEECVKDECRLSFKATLRNQEILFPFLILGSADDGSVFKPDNMSFDQQKGIIYLGIGSEREGEQISFIFPSCRGAYYTSQN